MRELLVISGPSGAKKLAAWGEFQCAENSLAICPVVLESESEYHKLLEECRELFAQGESVGIKPMGFWPKALFFDMDATVIAEESIDCLAEEKGCEVQVSQVTKKAMNGEVSFEQALKERVQLLAGLTARQVREVKDRLNLIDGMRELAKFAQKQSIPFYIVSGGFSVIAQEIAADLGAAGCHANVLEFEDGRLSGSVSETLVDGQEKARWLTWICKQRGWNPKLDVMAVGDGANDRWMMESVAVAMGFHPKKVLKSYLTAANFTGSHHFLVDFLKLGSSV